MNKNRDVKEEIEIEEDYEEDYNAADFINHDLHYKNEQLIRENVSLLNEINRRGEKLVEKDAQIKELAKNHKSYKDRLMRQVKKDGEFVLQPFLEDFISVLDDLENALKIETQDQEFKEGIDIIYKNILSILNKHDVVQVNEVGVGVDYDIHHAIAKVPGNEGEVIEIYRPGYVLKGRTIRPAMVSVGSG